MRPQSFWDFWTRLPRAPPCPLGPNMAAAGPKTAIVDGFQGDSGVLCTCLRVPFSCRREHSLGHLLSVSFIGGRTGGCSAERRKMESPMRIDNAATVEGYETGVGSRCVHELRHSDIAREIRTGAAYVKLDHHKALVSACSSFVFKIEARQKSWAPSETPIPSCLGMPAPLIRGAMRLARALKNSLVSESSALAGRASGGF